MRDGVEGFRSDIEGLRALAVLSVLLYHADLLGFRGGYIGVDVFFVLSGFLITRLLAAEVAGSGRISLRSFWARRARRLLPASSLVLLATVISAWFLVDPLTRGFIGRSGIAAAAFGANLLFWSRGGYSHVALPEPLLHFWSLAVEEQFYLFWPVLLLAAATTAGRQFRRVVIALSLALGGASLWLCITKTPLHSSFTFYWLPARAWELLAGALLAFAPPALARVAPFFRATLGWAGLAVLGLGWFTYGDPQQTFPGYRALLPVLATCAVIVGGTGAPDGPVVLLSLRPLQWVGKRSYAIYLWHFPLLVLADAKWGPLNAGTRAALLGAAVALAALSFVLVEHPVRSSGWLGARPLRSVALGLGLAGVSIGVSFVIADRARPGAASVDVAAPTLVTVAATTSTTEPVTEVPTSAPEGGSDSSVVARETTTAVATTMATTTSAPVTIPPPSVDNHPSLVALAAANRSLVEGAVANQLVPRNLQPRLEDAFVTKPLVYTDGCILDDGQTTPKPCEYGDTASSTTILLLGASHAAQWFPALEAVATAHHWRLVVIAKKHCPAADVPQQQERYTHECAGWRNKALARIDEVKPTVAVIGEYWFAGPSWSTYRVGLERVLRRVKGASGRVVLMGDVPRHTFEVPTCVAGHPKSLTRCLVDRAVAINPKRASVDAVAAQHAGVDRVLPDDWLCGASSCPAVIGNVLMYRDDNHLSPAGSALLAPYIEAMLLVYIPQPANGSSP